MQLLKEIVARGSSHLLKHIRALWSAGVGREHSPSQWAGGGRVLAVRRGRSARVTTVTAAGRTELGGPLSEIAVTAAAMAGGSRHGGVPTVRFFLTELGDNPQRADSCPARRRAAVLRLVSVGAFKEERAALGERRPDGITLLGTCIRCAALTASGWAAKSVDLRCLLSQLVGALGAANTSNPRSGTSVHRK